MKLRDVDINDLMRKPDDFDQQNQELMEFWHETFGDTTHMMPPNVLTRQGGGDGIYIADLAKQKEYSEIYREVEWLNRKNGAKIVSAPLDPSGSKTYLKSEADYFYIDDIRRFDNLIRRTDGFTFLPTNRGSIYMYLSTDRLFKKLNEPKSNIGYSPELGEFPYVPLTDASCEEIFFADTALDHASQKYDLNKIHDIAQLKNFLDFLTDTDDLTEELLLGLGGVDDIVYDAKTGIAYLRCLINEFDVKTDGPENAYYYVHYNEIMPYLLSAEGMAAVPAYRSEWQSLMWLVFSFSVLK